MPMLIADAIQNSENSDIHLYNLRFESGEVSNNLLLANSSLKKSPVQQRTLSLNTDNNHFIMIMKLSVHASRTRTVILTVILAKHSK